MFNLNVNETLEQANQSVFPVEAGRKLVRITGVESRPFQKATSDGIGLKVTYGVILPASEKGKEFIVWYNAKHSNPTAEQIGRQELAKLASACDVYQLETGDELTGKDLVVEVRCIPASEKYNFPSIKISKYEPYKVSEAVAEEIKQQTGVKLGIIGDVPQGGLKGGSQQAVKAATLGSIADDDIPF